MTPSERFNNFYAALQKSNTIWWELTIYKFSKKDLPDVAQKLLIELYAEGFDGKNIDWKQVQNRFAKMLTWEKDKVEVQHQKAEPVVIHPQAVPFGPKRDEWLKKYQAAIDAMPMLKPAYKPSDDEVEKEGQVRPKAIPFVRSETEKILVARQTVKDAQNARRKYFLEAYPDAEPEEVEAYVNKFIAIDNPDGI